MGLETIGMPGVGTTKRAVHKIVFRQYNWESGLAGGRAIDGSKSRDPTNGTNPQNLQAGLLMGMITASKLWAPSIIGKNTVAILGTDTSITVLAGTATEIIRRLGATGTFKMTGPAAASGVVRTLTLTYSAVGATTITITAPKINEVQRIDFGAAATGGNLALQVPLASGGLVTTGTMAWSATDATFLGNINTALDAATGVTGGIVATAIPATDTDLGIILTFSGTGYTGNTYGLVNVVTKPTSVTTAAVSRSTSGDSGAFVANSFIQPIDGSETIRSLLPDWFARQAVDSTGADVTFEFPDIPLAGVIMPAKLVNWPADASLKTYVKAALNAVGKYVFDDDFGST